MTLSTALLLATPLVNLIAGPAWTFQDMADSANLVVIARIDSMWYTTDTLYRSTNCGQRMYLSALTHWTAEPLSVYVRHDSLTPPDTSIHIVHPGGVTSEGYIETVNPQLHFEDGEVFLAALVISRRSTDLFPAYVVRKKYAIENDSLFPKWGDDALPLHEALLILSSSMRQVK